MRRSALALLTALVLVLAGCAAIPTTGPVRKGNVAAQNDAGLSFQPYPPSDGASQTDIVRGFVQAAIAGDDYAVARQFLTPALRRTWQPNARVLVYNVPWTPKQTADDRVELTVPLSARVDEGGVYTPSSGRPTIDFDLQQVSGQWRIAATPDGIVLPQDVFQRNFVPTTLGFFDSSGTRLVPDLRWFPKRESEDAAIVRALAAGPSDPLLGVVSDVFPTSVELASAPTTTGDQTTVRLTTDGDPPQAEQVTRMQQQIAKSLGITTSRLRLVVNGTVAARAPQLEVQQPDVRPIVLADGRFGTLGASGVQDLAGLGKRIAALEPIAVTVSARQKLAAVATSAGAVAVTPSTQRRVDTRPGLVPPTLDQQGWIFSVPADDPNGLIAVKGDGSPVPIANTLPGVAIDSIETSPDGSRLLVVSQTAGGSRASVLGIVRGTDGTPVALTSADYPLTTGDEAPIGGTWIDDRTVALITSTADGQQTVTDVSVGGLTSAGGRLAGAAAIVGNTGSADVELRALVLEGALYDRRGNDWLPVSGAPRVQVLAVQR